MFEATVTNLLPWWDVIAMLCRIIGVVLVGVGLMGYATAAENNGVSSGMSSGNALGAMFIGAMLCVPFYVLDILMMSLFERPSRRTLDYTVNTTSGLGIEAASMVATVYVIIAFAGLIFFLRGWLKLRGRKEGEGVGPGITHIIGAVLMINMDVTVLVLAAFVGSFNLELANNIRIFIPN